MAEDQSSITSIDMEFIQLQMTYFRSLEAKEAELATEVTKLQTEISTAGQAPFLKEQWKKLQAPCHKFAGSSGTYGFTGLCENLRFIDDHVSDGSFAELTNEQLRPVLTLWWKCHQGIYKVYASLIPLAEQSDGVNFASQVPRLDLLAKNLSDRMTHELSAFLKKGRIAA